MITSDSHMHTRFSTDSDADIRDMIESALKKDCSPFVLPIILTKIIRFMKIPVQRHFWWIWMSIFRSWQSGKRHMRR